MLDYSVDPSDPNLPGHEECAFSDPEGDQFCVLRSPAELAALLDAGPKP